MLIHYSFQKSPFFRHLFIWQLVMFIIYNYYILQAVMASCFYSMYLITVTKLMPLNYVCFVLMIADLVLQLILTPAPVFLKIDDHRKPGKIIRYYLFRKLLVIDFLFVLLFISSYFVPFYLAKWFRNVILVKLWYLVEFNSKIYQKMHTHPIIRKLYTIIKISYIMLLFSHYFGTWFYLIDQVLLNQQYYGSPAQANQLYYQMNLLCYTPIEALDDLGRYLYGLYFMVSLITTIAYGDIVGKNPYQQVYVSVLMVLSTVSLGLILEQFMDLVRYDSLGLYDFIKNYNSLKTFMDDSQVSYPVQNRVRSYLVYTEYEKKYHAHEQVAEKLTQKLQLDLKKQSYSIAIEKWIIPRMPELNNSLNQLCKICKLVSFQAQTDIYQELQTVETATQCCFLYKLEGLVEEYVQMGNTRAKIAVGSKRQFNLSKLFLNFNMEVAYDSDEESELEFSIQGDNESSAPTLYSLITIHNRKLKSVKISQFILLDAEEFYQLVNTRKIWFKRIKQMKQNILSRDIDLKDIGEQCSLCGQNAEYDHSVENCPFTHFVHRYEMPPKNSGCGYGSIRELASRQQKRQLHRRKNRKTNKSFKKGTKIVSEEPQKQQEQYKVVEGGLAAALRHLIAGITITKNQIDSKYDPNGLNSDFQIVSADVQE